MKCFLPHKLYNNFLKFTSEETSIYVLVLQTAGLRSECGLSAFTSSSRRHRCRHRQPQPAGTPEHQTGLKPTDANQQPRISINVPLSKTLNPPPALWKKTLRAKNVQGKRFMCMKPPESPEYLLHIFSTIDTETSRDVKSLKRDNIR